MKDPEKRGLDFMEELDSRIQALTPEQMLDTSEEDARTKENFKFADALHQARASAWRQGRNRAGAIEQGG